MNRLAYLLSLICILAFSSCEEDKVYYHTAAKADFTWLQPYEEKSWVQYFMPYQKVS